MKLSTPNKDNPLRKNNLQVLADSLKGAKLPPKVTGVALLIADLFDHIAVGDEMYLVIGSTKDHSAFTITIKQPDASTPIYGQDLEELSTKAYELV